MCYTLGWLILSGRHLSALDNTVVGSFGTVECLEFLLCPRGLVKLLLLLLLRLVNDASFSLTPDQRVAKADLNVAEAKNMARGEGLIAYSAHDGLRWRRGSHEWPLGTSSKH